MKLNISMDFVKPMAGAMKKYRALLPSVAITAVALLLFLPTMLVGNKVKGKMEQSAQKAKTVRSLLRDVPSRHEPQQVKSYMDKLEDEVGKIKEAAIQSSQRNLVTYDYVIFPEPKDPSSQVYLEFGINYSRAIEKLIQEMNALDAPSDTEIRNRTGGGGARPNYRMVNQAVDVQDPMVDALCLTRAQEISVYANPSAFPWYAFWEKYEFSGKDQALEDCWDSQVALWIYEDIVDTIRKMNGESGKVLTAPVKRLLGVSFSGPVVAERNQTLRYSPRMGGSMQMRDIPNYVMPRRISKFVPVPPTGRISNQEVDIIHFAVSVIVDNRFVLSFMKELCTEKPHTFYPSVFREPFQREGEPVEARHNQISILQSDLKVVDKSSPNHELYRYGKAAVVQLDLICEYQFERDGYDMIKPDPVKKRLGQFEEQSQDSQQMPGMSEDVFEF